MAEVALRLEEVLRAAADRLKTAGWHEPRREALRLWAGLHDSDPGTAYLTKSEPVGTETVLEYEAALERLLDGEPLAYVTGRVGFRRLLLGCDRRALIPRPETEGLVDLVLQRQSTGIIADVGTGSGCIGLSLRQEGAYQTVIGVDLSAAALALAAENAERSDLRLGLVRGDLCSAISPGSLDAVVANPPYLTDGEYSTLDRSVRDWEPALALPSGLDGLEATGRLAQQAFVAVRSQGWLALEVDAVRAQQAARLAAQAGWSDVSIHQDLFGRARFVVARRSEAA